MEATLGRRALILGAAGNLGIATVKKFLDARYKIIAVDKKVERLTDLVPELIESKENLLIDSFDVTAPGQVEDLVLDILKKYVSIDVLINTIGGYRAGNPLHETSIETFDFLHNLNVKSTFMACKSVIPQMLLQGYGKIISIAARPGMMGRKNMAAYSASKARTERPCQKQIMGIGLNQNQSQM